MTTSIIGRNPLGEGTLDLTVVLLTYNESRHIERAIASVRHFARDIVVVDSFSSDDTVALAKSGGARVLQNRFINQSKQFQWGMDNGGITTEWVMRLDADELIESDLAAELTAIIPSLAPDVVGINLDRKHIFMGRWIRHGGRYPLRLLRVWRRNCGRIEDRWMDEHIVVWGGRSITLKGGFADWNLNDLTFFTDKHNKYATREAVERISKEYCLFLNESDMSMASGSWQAAIKRWIKENIYNILPFWVAPIGYFIFRYIIQLGFLDGAPGLVYHFLQGFWYRFLVEAKVMELQSAIAYCRNNDERISRLAELTNLDLRGANG